VNCSWRSLRCELLRAMTPMISCLVLRNFGVKTASTLVLPCACWMLPMPLGGDPIACWRQFVPLWPTSNVLSLNSLLARPVSIAVLYKLCQSLNRLSQLFNVDRAIVSTRVRELSSELGQQLLKNYKDSEHADSLGVFDVLATEVD
jgi:hypothetical protein